MSDKSTNKKIYKIVGTIAIGWSLLMGGAIIGSYTAQKSFEIKDPYLKKIILSWDLIQKNSVLNTKDPKVNEKIMDNTIKAMASSIDVHSTWYTEKETKQVFEKLSGEYVGIGISYHIEKEGGVIVKVFSNSPMEKLNIVPDDIITKVEGKKLFAELKDNKKVIMLGDQVITEDDLSNVLKGEEGTKLSLTVKRHETGKEETFQVTRTKIVSANIQSEIKDLGNKGHWLKISILDFQENTLKEVSNHIRNLWADAKRKNIKLDGVVLDLQNSPGGIVPVSVSVASLFLPKDAKVVSIIQKDEKDIIEKTYTLPKEPWTDWLKTTELVVWNNRKTASAAEILIGALKDNNRIKFILGDYTYGKGVVQSIYKIDNDSLSFSTGWYTTPSGNYIQGNGIKPDYRISYPEKLTEEINRTGEKYMPNYLAAPIPYKDEGKILGNYFMDIKENWNEKNIIDWYWNTTEKILNK